MARHALRRSLRLIAAGIFLGTAYPVRAAGPLLVNGAGEPLKWDSSVLVPFNPDQGTLGTLTNAEAVTLVADSFAAWEAVQTSTVSFTNAGALPVDVTAGNVFAFLGACEGLSPIIFDTDGSIIDFLFGPGAGDVIVAFAGPECGFFVPPRITEAIAGLNGRFIDGVGPVEISLTDFTAAFRHEFGHFLNLDHTQLNITEALDGDPTNDFAVPTMFPLLVNGAEQLSLHKDDAVSVSVLYPEPAFFPSTGAITGLILPPPSPLFVGGTPFQGANVIARNVADPLVDATSNVSGARFFPFSPGGPPPAALQGLYEHFGLTPGASYTVEIEQIDPRFTGGSSVGPLDPPATLPGPPEFWNDGNEAATDPPDNPTEATPITVAAGVPVTGIDIIINRFPPPPNDECTTATVIPALPFTDTINTSGATTGPEDIFQTCGFPPNSNSVWYTFTAPAAGTVVANTLGSSYDTVLSAYTGTCGALTEIACNDDAVGPQSEVSLLVTAGQTVLLEVTDFDPAPGGGTLVLNATFIPALPPIPPGTDLGTVLHIGDGGRGGVFAFADLDGNLVADAQATLSAPGSPAGNPGFTPAELDVDGEGDVVGSDSISDSVFTFTDPDGDFVADAFASFSSGLVSDGDGMRFRRSDGVLFVSDASSGGTIATFRDTTGDNVPDVSTIFAPAPGTIDPASGISIDFDAAGNVFVIDVFGGAILTFTDGDGDLVADSSTVFTNTLPGAVALKIDRAGRVFVVDALSGSIVILEDTDGDLVADVTTTFTTGLLIPFSPSNGTTFDASGNVYVINDATTILVFTDANGDLVADGPAVIYTTVLRPAAGLAFGTAGELRGRGL
jgi:hypothetical protein